MSKPETMLDIVIAYYVEKYRGGRFVENNELKEINNSIRQLVLSEALPLIEKEKLEEAKRKVEQDIKSYRRKLLRELRVSLIVETIFIAFVVGIIVNQVTNYISERYSVLTVVIGILLCVLLVLLLTSEREK